MNARTPLKGYQLFLLGLASMLIGTYVVAKYVSEIAGGILVFAGLFLWAVAIIVGIKNIAGRKRGNLAPPDLDMSNPGSVENSVKIQLHCYKGYKAKYPKEEPTQLYIRVLADRPGYSKEDIKAVLSQAQSPAAHGGYNFQSVVTSMLMQEYMQDNNGDVPDSMVNEIVDTVERLIPRNI